MNEEMERLKAKEEWLRLEINSNRTLMMSLLQWGTTLLAGVESSLYFLRKDVAEHLVAIKSLKPGDLLSWPRWTTGTVFLILIASIFSSLDYRVQRRHVAYRRQLIDLRACT
jgi:hypothetical protein